ncbi:MAG: glutamate ABC transporter substrate-binding protein [Coriobacteriales bacterium]|nr:glutamate ABC transporter substrate-binding protein [Coriobacteriales bacterium]
MKKLDTLTLSRRQLVALGMGTTAAFGLAACSSQPAASSSSTSDASTSDASSSSADSSSTASAEIDADAFDKIVAAGTTASDKDIEASTWAAKVKKSGKLRVGGVETSTLFSLLNEADGKHRGFDAGLFQLLAKYILGDASAYDLTLVQSSTRESVLQNDTVDAVFATYTITDERKKLISFAGPYYVGHQGILVAESNTDINALEDLKGKNVGVQTGSTAASADFIKEYMPEATIQELGTDEELRRALEQGRIDAYVVDATLHMGSIIKNPGKYRLAAEFGPEDPLGIGLPLDSDGVAFVNNFLKAIEADGTWAALYECCLGSRIGATKTPEPPAIAS